MATQDEMQKLAMEMNYYRTQAEEVQTQITQINNLIRENAGAREALKALPVKDESLFAIGEGVFVKAKPSSDKVLIEIGARVVVEKTFEEADGIIEARNSQLVKALASMQDSMQELSRRMAELNQKAEALQGNSGTN